MKYSAKIAILLAIFGNTNSHAEEVLASADRTTFYGRVGYSDLRVGFHPKDKPDDSIEYSPEGNVIFGIGTHSRDFSFQVATSPQGSADIDLQASWYTKGFLWRAYYLSYRNYVIDDVDRLDLRTPDDNDYRDTIGLQARALGGGLTWVANWEKFSYSSAFAQTNRLKEWAGSFLVKLILDRGYVTSPLALAPSSQADAFREGANITSVTTLAYGLAAGGAITVFMGAFYFSGALTVGPGMSQQEIETTEPTTGEVETREREGEFFYVGTILSLGWNSDDMYAAFDIVSDLNDHTLRYSTINYQIFETNFLRFGVRI